MASGKQRKFHASLPPSAAHKLLISVTALLNYLDLCVLKILEDPFDPPVSASVSVAI